jgi:ferric-dicitrate binding protein FerR (iron transport regulator)
MTVLTLRPSTGSRVRTAVRPAARPVRLTRRGRRVAGGLAVAAAALAAFLLSLALGGGALASSHASNGSPYQGMRQVVVQPGQNLWALATRAEPGADPRLVIPQIVSANALAGDAIYPGEQLWVPR